jgi:hypothetical protein
VSAIVALAFLCAVGIVSQGTMLSSEPTVMIQKNGDGWIQAVNNLLSDKNSISLRTSTPTMQLALSPTEPAVRFEFLVL